MFMRYIFATGVIIALSLCMVKADEAMSRKTNGVQSACGINGTDKSKQFPISTVSGAGRAIVRIGLPRYYWDQSRRNLLNEVRIYHKNKFVHSIRKEVFGNYRKPVRFTLEGAYAGDLLAIEWIDMNGCSLRSSSNITLRSKKGGSAFNIAVHFNDVMWMQGLLKDMSQKITDLMLVDGINLALEKSNKAMVTILENEINFHKAGLFNTVVSRGYYEIVDMFIRHGANIEDNDVYRDTALINTIKLNDVRMVNKLLEAGANINAQGTSGTPIAVAIYKMKSEKERVKVERILRLLLEKGANVNTAIKNSGSSTHTVLMHAADGAQFQAIKLLLEHGASLNTHDYMGYTPLMHAIEAQIPPFRDRCKEIYSIVKLMLSYNPDINIMDKINRTSLDHEIGQHSECPMIQQLLIDASGKRGCDL